MMEIYVIIEKAASANRMDKYLNLKISPELSEELLSNPDKYRELENHCEGVATTMNLHEFSITDTSGRVVYTSGSEK